ncbi:MAG: hypothetical protein ACTSWD_04825 [Candidatus Heimdallarchaeota archaeon]
MSVQLPQPFPTELEIKELKRDKRCFQIEKDVEGNVIEVSWKDPCINCGKYHRLFSKPQKRCSMIIACQVANVLMEEDAE